MVKDSFVFYRSFYEALQNVPKKHRTEVYEAVFEYAFESREPSISGVPRALWELIRPQLDASQKRYENAKKGAEYGKLGGRPRKKEENKKPLKGYESETLNVNVNENVNDNVNVNVNVNDNVNDKRTSVKRFTPPTAEEVQAYCNERNNGVDGQHFVDYYEARGWKIGGKQPMKDWKAAVRTWERSGYNKPQTANTSTGAFQYGEAELAAIRALKRGRTNT